jgi:hypothetical protein
MPRKPKKALAEASAAPFQVAPASDDASPTETIDPETGELSS